MNELGVMYFNQFKIKSYEEIREVITENRWQLNTGSKYFETKVGTWAQDFDEKQNDWSGSFVILLRLKSGVTPGMILSTSIDHPSGDEEWDVVIPHPHSILLKSPPRKDFLPRIYTAKIRLYSNAAKEELLSTHIQTIQCGLDTRGVDTLQDFLEKFAQQNAAAQQQQQQAQQQAPLPSSSSQSKPQSPQRANQPSSSTGRPAAIESAEKDYDDDDDDEQLNEPIDDEFDFETDVSGVTGATTTEVTELFEKLKQKRETIEEDLSNLKDPISPEEVDNLDLGEYFASQFGEGTTLASKERRIESRARAAIEAFFAHRKPKSEEQAKKYKEIKEKLITMKSQLEKVLEARELAREQFAKILRNSVFSDPSAGAEYYAKRIKEIKALYKWTESMQADPVEEPTGAGYVSPVLEDRIKDAYDLKQFIETQVELEFPDLPEEFALRTWERLRKLFGDSGNASSVTQKEFDQFLEEVGSERMAYELLVHAMRMKERHDEWLKVKDVVEAEEVEEARKLLDAQKAHDAALKEEIHKILAEKKQRALDQTKDAPEGAPEGAPEDAPEGAPEGAPEDAPEDAPEGAPEGAPEETETAIVDDFKLTGRERWRKPRFFRGKRIPEILRAPEGASEGAPEETETATFSEIYDEQLKKLGISSFGLFEHLEGENEKEVTVEDVVASVPLEEREDNSMPKLMTWMISEEVEGLRVQRRPRPLPPPSKKAIEILVNMCLDPEIEKKHILGDDAEKQEGAVDEMTKRRELSGWIDSDIPSVLPIDDEYYLSPSGELLRRVHEEISTNSDDDYFKPLDSLEYSFGRKPSTGVEPERSDQPEESDKIEESVEPKESEKPEESTIEPEESVESDKPEESD